MSHETKRFIFNAIANLINFCNDKYDVALWPGGPNGAAYLNGLVRDKGNQNHRGSYVPGLTDILKTIEFLQKQKWYEINPDAARKGCRYFASDLLKSGSDLAYIGVVSLGSCRDEKWSVVKRQGEHGPELIHHNSNQKMATNRICLIVEDEMMSTWHPGNPMHELPKEIPDDPSEWNDNWPVKLV